MIMYEMTLSIDFGEVGNRHARSLFRVRLDAAPLAELIRAADGAHRIYELLLIDRPGDVWDYVWVLLDEMPKLNVAGPREEKRPGVYAGVLALLDACVKASSGAEAAGQERY